MVEISQEQLDRYLELEAAHDVMLDAIHELRDALAPFLVTPRDLSKATDAIELSSDSELDHMIKTIVKDRKRRSKHSTD